MGLGRLVVVVWVIADILPQNVLFALLNQGFYRRFVDTQRFKVHFCCCIGPLASNNSSTGFAPRTDEQGSVHLSTYVVKVLTCNCISRKDIRHAGAVQTRFRVGGKAPVCAIWDIKRLWNRCTMLVGRTLDTARERGR
jgi:hypothetical protein